MSDYDMVFIARVIGFILLGFITYQVIGLRFMLYSWAWNYLALGFVTFSLLLGVSLFVDLPTIIRLSVSVLGYILISIGLHIMRRDLIRILKPPKEKPQ